MYQKTDNSFRLASDREVKEKARAFFKDTLVKERDTDLFWRAIQLKYFQAVCLLVKHTASLEEQNFDKVFNLIALGNDEIDNLFTLLAIKDPADTAVLFYDNVKKEVSCIPRRTSVTEFRTGEQYG